MDVYHIGDNKEAYRNSIVLVSGSMNRAKEIGEKLDNRLLIPGKRPELSAYHGTYKGLRTVSIPDLSEEPIAALSTGMGPSSTDIVVRELIDLGAHYILRVGSCGVLQSHPTIGSMCIASSAFPDESVSEHYHKWEKDAPADRSSIDACITAAKLLDYEHHVGACHTKASLERELRRGPRATYHREFMRKIEEQGYLFSEMEASVIFTLAHCLVEQHAPDYEVLKKMGADSIEQAQDIVFFGTSHLDILNDDELLSLGRTLGLHQRIIRKKDNAKDPLEVKAGCVCVAVGGYDPQLKKVIPYGSPEQIKKGEEDIVFMALESARQWSQLLNINPTQSTPWP